MTPPAGRHSPRNTEEEFRQNPIIPFVEALFAGNASRAIVASEAAGQRQQTRRDFLQGRVLRPQCQHVHRLPLQRPSGLCARGRRCGGGIRCRRQQGHLHDRAHPVARRSGRTFQTWRASSP